MAKRHPKARPVIVRWIDSISTGGWCNDPRSKMECTTVGHLVERTKKGVTVALNRSHYGNGDFIEIPASAIRSVRRLKEYDGKKSS